VIGIREYSERCADYYARAYGVSSALVRAIIQIESGWQPGVVSSKGAMGLMQLMPATAEHYGVAHPFYIKTFAVGLLIWPTCRLCLAETYGSSSQPTPRASGRFLRKDWITHRRKCMAMSRK
jgi:hypothetical protein